MNVGCRPDTLGWAVDQNKGYEMTAGVLCVGRNSVDFVFDVDLSGVRADAKQRTSDPIVLIGGQCVNAAATLAALGSPVTYLGVVGGDASGACVMDFLRECGIAVGAVEVAKGLANPCAYILVDHDSGERSIVETAPPEFPSHSGNLPDDVWATIDQVYFDGHETEASLKIAHEARARGVPTTTDVEIVTPETLALLALVETAIVPKSVAVEIAGSDVPAEMLAGLAALGGYRHIVTLGAEGAVGAMRGGEVVKIPAADAHVIDTTGAGDAFHAGFIFSDMAGASFARSMEFAARVAALACEFRGPSADAVALGKLAARASRETWTS